MRSPIGRIDPSFSKPERFEAVDNVHDRAAVHVHDFTEPDLGERLGGSDRFKRTQLRRGNPERVERQRRRQTDADRRLIEQIPEPTRG